MGIEPSLAVWDKRKQGPLPGRCRCVLGGPLLAERTRSRTSAIERHSGWHGGAPYAHTPVAREIIAVFATT
jgi:hypothetical protein